MHFSLKDMADDCGPSGGIPGNDRETKGSGIRRSPGPCDQNRLVPVTADFRRNPIRLPPGSASRIGGAVAPTS